MWTGEGAWGDEGRSTIKRGKVNRKEREGRKLYLKKSGEKTAASEKGGRGAGHWGQIVMESPRGQSKSIEEGKG